MRTLGVAEKFCKYRGTQDDFGMIGRLFRWTLGRSFAPKVFGIFFASVIVLVVACCSLSSAALFAELLCEFGVGALADVCEQTVFRLGPPAELALGFGAGC